MSAATAVMILDSVWRGYKITWLRILFIILLGIFVMWRVNRGLFNWFFNLDSN